MYVLLLLRLPTQTGACSFVETLIVGHSYLLCRRRHKENDGHNVYFHEGYTVRGDVCEKFFVYNVTIVWRKKTEAPEQFIMCIFRKYIKYTFWKIILWNVHLALGAHTGEVCVTLACFGCLCSWVLCTHCIVCKGCREVVVMYHVALILSRPALSSAFFAWWLNVLVNYLIF